MAAAYALSKLRPVLGNAILFMMLATLMIPATVLVIPITLGTVMVAEGLLTYLGPRGWLNRSLMAFGLTDSPIEGGDGNREFLIAGRYTP